MQKPFRNLFWSPLEQLWSYSKLRFYVSPRRKKPLFIRPAVPLKKDSIQSKKQLFVSLSSLFIGLKYPQTYTVGDDEMPRGLVGTLIRLLACFDEEYRGNTQVKALLASPSMLSFALRSLEIRERKFQPSKSDIVHEACSILASLLDFIYQKKRRPGEIPADSTLARCYFYLSTVRTRPLIEKLCSMELEKEDVRFLVRALQDPRWRSKASGISTKCFDPTWRITPRRPGAQKKQKLIFYRNNPSQSKQTEKSCAIVSVSSIRRLYWRLLPVEVYSNSQTTWILSTKELMKQKKNTSKEEPANMQSSMPSIVYELSERQRHSFENQLLDWDDVHKQRSELQRKIHWFVFTDIFNKVKQNFNQRVQKLSSPNTIPVVNRPAPSLTDPNRKITFEMRRMVPTIHWQRYRGMQLRERYQDENAIAVYWYNSHFRDILATLSELETRLRNKGLHLPQSVVVEPRSTEIRRSM